MQFTLIRYTNGNIVLLIHNKSPDLDSKDQLGFLVTIVFKPDLVAGPGFDRVTGRPGQFFFFLINKNKVVLVKKTKVNGLQPGY